MTYKYAKTMIENKKALGTLSTEETMTYLDTLLTRGRITQSQYNELCDTAGISPISGALTVVELAAENTALKNSLDAHFDGLKYVADRHNPVTLTLPMYVVANLIYRYEEKNYVCFKTGMAAEEEFDEFFVEDIE